MNWTTNELKKVQSGRESCSPARRVSEMRLFTDWETACVRSHPAPRIPRPRNAEPATKTLRPRAALGRNCRPDIRSGTLALLPSLDSRAVVARPFPPIRSSRAGRRGHSVQSFGTIRETSVPPRSSPGPSRERAGKSSNCAVYPSLVAALRALCVYPASTPRSSQLNRTLAFPLLQWGLIRTMHVL